MRKFIGVILAAVMLTVGLGTGTVSAANKVIQVVLNGTVQQYAQPPIVLNGTTMVPMRGIFEGLGAKLTVKGSQITAVKGSTIVIHTIGEKTALVNGKKITLTQGSVVLRGTTLVPLRFVGEALGAKVSWDAVKSIVTVTGQTDEEQQEILDEKASQYVIAGNYNGLKDLLAKGWKPAESTTPFVFSILARNMDMVRFFLEHGSSVDLISKFDDDGYLSILEIASLPYKITTDSYVPTQEADDLELVKLLLQYKPDIALLEKANGSILWTAINANRLTIVQELLKAGASAKADTSTDFGAPLTAAARLVDDNGNRSPQMVELLLKKGADPNECNCDRSKYYTPLEYASGMMFGEDDNEDQVEYLPDPVVVKLLLQYGADPKKDHSLYEAVAAGSLEIAKLLLNAGADPKKINQSSSLTPLAFAKANDDAAMTALLQSYVK